MTKISHTKTTALRKASRFSMLALALSLSTGTVAGMFGIAALTSGPAQAQQGGNGGGGPAGDGGAGSNPMVAGRVESFNRAEPNNEPNYGRGRTRSTNCEGSQNGLDSDRCKNNQRSTPRIVRINGFNNCAIVQQVPNPNGGPAEFYCLRPM
ncbi:MAG: hypothetical protein O9322_04890 [Beijerinckiaceae bacterium]|nr:hypothetical protein [Beijerinckiaceae bacterium]MCZ8298857.1 hypothetical protein [Beijerinckiaceae bacterium]